MAYQPLVNRILSLRRFRFFAGRSGGLHEAPTAAAERVVLADVGGRGRGRSPHRGDGRLRAAL